jgi:hypothetical protein
MEYLNITDEGDPLMLTIDEKDVITMGRIYGLIDHGTQDFDLLWIAREALLNRLKTDTKKQVFKQ